jgi:BTB/POZ domain
MCADKQAPSPRHSRPTSVSPAVGDSNLNASLSFQPTLSVDAAMSVCQSLTSLAASANCDPVNTSNVDSDVDKSAACISTAFTYEDKSLWANSFGFLNEFYKSGKFSDVEIHVGSLRVSCHRIVLACFSQYFR